MTYSRCHERFTSGLSLIVDAMNTENTAADGVVRYEDCRFEAYVEPLGREYGDAAGRKYPGVRATHIPSGVVAENNTCPLEMHNREAAMNKLTNMLASPEQAALVDAMSWSNANCYFEGGDYRMNNDIDHRVAADILRGLEHLGWKLVPVDV